MDRLDMPVLEQPVHTGHEHEQDAAGRARLLRRGLLLEYASLGWNLVEGVVAIAAGLAAGSVALVGFGVDSFVESASAGVIVWRIFAERRSTDPARVQAIERLSQKLVAASLALLGIYVLYGSITALVSREQPGASLPGIILAVASLSVMWWLSRAIRRVGEQLHSHSIEADSAQTMACWWMSVSLLIGLGLNMLFGWWWADPLAGIAIAGFVLREGWNAWRGKDCCAI